jgi:hypothetical protein
MPLFHSVRLTPGSLRHGTERLAPCDLFFPQGQPPSSPPWPFRPPLSPLPRRQSPRPRRCLLPQGQNRPARRTPDLRLQSVQPDPSEPGQMPPPVPARPRRSPPGTRRARPSAGRCPPGLQFFAGSNSPGASGRPGTAASTSRQPRASRSSALARARWPSQEWSRAVA